MTVYKAVQVEAEAAAELAVALSNGEDPSALATGTVPDTELGTDVPSVLAEPAAIYRDNVIELGSWRYGPPDQHGPVVGVGTVEPARRGRPSRGR